MGDIFWGFICRCSLFGISKKAIELSVLAAAASLRISLKLCLDLYFLDELGKARKNALQVQQSLIE